MSESTKRALRTALQLAIALPTIAPVLAMGVEWLAGQLGASHPVAVWSVSALTAVTAVSKVMGVLEERGLLRPVLRTLGDDGQDGASVS